MDGYDKFEAAFDKYFANFKNIPIALYGIGQNAEIILNCAKGYNFVALIATEHIGETRYGKEIISIEEAVKKAQMILIAAVPASTSIIYQRIQALIPETMPVFDMRGHELRGRDYYRENPYWRRTKEELFQQIDEHRVISFDVFDTLITRKVLYPADVFHLTERDLRKQGIDFPFARWRMSAERECGRETSCPGIDQIYEKMRLEYGLEETVLRKAKHAELQTEFRVVRPREAVVEAFRYALECGKEVYLTSDMYLSKETVQQMLQKCGISAYRALFVSCECGTGKSEGGLYDILKAHAPEGSILHIGDSLEADIVGANACGIDAYQVMSGRDMLASSSIAYLLDAAKSLDERLLLGTMASDSFNDPFALNPYGGKVQILSFRELAYCFLPVTGLFLSFIIRQADQYDAILFPSRDGFFLHRLYCAARETHRKEVLPEAFYFYASRSAVSSSAVFEENDILVLCSKLFEDKKLNIREFMKHQFQIEVPEEYDLTSGQAIERWGKEGLWQKIRSNREVIFNKSTENRKRYLRYIRRLGLERFEKVAIVDIVTQGTLVYGLSKLLGKQIDLISLGTSAVPNGYIRDLNRVFSVWGNINEKWRDLAYSLSDFSQLHLFLEMLYASEEGQFVGFSEAGGILTLDGTEYDLELVRNTQEEMASFIRQHQDIHWESISKEFSLSAMRMLYSAHTDMSNRLRAKFSFQDSYDGNTPICNLMDCLG